MLFRTLSPETSAKVRPAFRVFSAVQDAPGSPFALLFQSEHSRLAGQLAEALNPSLFGALNRDVVTAIANHDAGWNPNDRKQLDSLAVQMPTTFTKLSPSETVPNWIGSIARGQQLGSLAEVLISRHCCLLGTGSGKYTTFVEQEIKRREVLERSLDYSPHDLDRWTNALGFCDLVSLYLCSGARSPVTMSLGHPEMSGNDRQITLTWIDDHPHFSESILDTTKQFTAEAVIYKNENALSPQALRWSFV
jgi:Protein of unknown function (DUF3891)